MSSVNKVLRVSPLDAIVQRCSDETQRFFQRLAFDPQYCFELFRRALGKGDQLAWEAVYQQYGSLVRGWALAHPAIVYTGGEVQDYVNQAFARMWAAVSRSGFARFDDLKAVLAYLKMCVHSAIVEDGRRAGPVNRTIALDDASESIEAAQAAGPDSPTERAVLARDAQDRLWTAVNGRLQNPRERLVVHCLFELGLKPKAICALHPDMFGDVREIYLIRQVVLERLRRDPVLQELVDGRA